MHTLASRPRLRASLLALQTPCVSGESLRRLQRALVCFIEGGESKEGGFLVRLSPQEALAAMDHSGGHCNVDYVRAWITDAVLLHNGRAPASDSEPSPAREPARGLADSVRDAVVST